VSRVCIIFNPTAKGDKARRLRRHFEAFAGGCSLKPSLEAGAARVLAAEAVREGYDTIVAAGGDGTIHEVVNGMGEAPDGFAQARFGVIPTGTVNVFARELGIPFALKQAWAVIRRGREIRIDLPHIQFQTERGIESRYFAQMGGCGLDARAVELVDWELKKKIGQFAYVVAGFKALRMRPCAITAAGGAHCHSGPLVLLGNGRLYGGPVPIFGEADLRDGQLDVCVFPRVNWFVILRYACAYLSPKLLLRGREHHFQATTVSMSGPNAVPLELDGELVGRLPATCSVRPSLLRVLVP
jgi:YegS/Rv2252/BmrU family lipid kinase